MKYEIRVTRPELYKECENPDDLSNRQGYYFFGNTSLLQCIIDAAREMPDEKLDMQYWDKKERHGVLIEL